MAHKSDYGDKSGQDNLKKKKVKKKNIPTPMSGRKNTGHTGGY